MPIILLNQSYSLTDIILFLSFQISAPFIFAFISISFIMFTFLILSFVASLFDFYGNALLNRFIDAKLKNMNMKKN